jgi:uncharacterized protein YeaO (DUF488 family)
MIKISRIYESPQGEGYKILVDRLWPRGISKEEAKVDLWLKEIGPSNELRKWFGHDPEKWPDFKMRYFLELEGKRELVDQIIEIAKTRDVILLYRAKDEAHNNAIALKEYLEAKENVS